MTIPEKQAALKAFMAAVVASQKASTARADLPAGSSRAAVTSANARWSSAAEERERLAKQLPPELAASLQSWLTE